MKSRRHGRPATGGRGCADSTDREGERGAAIVELALVLPFLLVLLVGMFTVARSLNVKNTLDHAVREAARHGATIDPWDASTSPAAIRAIADSELAPAAISAGEVDTVCIELVASGATGCGGTVTNTTPADQVVVHLQYPDYDLDFVFFRSTVDLATSATARYES